MPLSISDSPAKYCHDMYRKIDRLITRFRPRRAVVLSFDGPAPFAKLQHQRAHRAADLDSCAITPGTTFMNAIDSGKRYLLRFLMIFFVVNMLIMYCDLSPYIMLEMYYYTNTRASLLSNVTLFYSGPNTPGSTKPLDY